jgi:3-oxoacyl-[acyl-carrier protein] reductase
MIMTIKHDHHPAGESSCGHGRPTALVTGTGRTVGIGASIADELAASGWDIAFTYWTAYDKRMPWGIEAGAADAIEGSLTSRGAAVATLFPHFCGRISPGFLDAAGVY